MALSASLKRVIGRDVTLTCDGAKTLWSKVDLSFKSNTVDATAADSTLDEVVFTTKIVEGTLSGFLGYTNNGATLPAVGDTISDLAVAVSTDSLIPALTDYTNIKVTDVKYNFDAGPSTFEVTYRSGVLN